MASFKTGKAKKLRVTIENETIKNDLICKALQELLNPKGITVDKGIIEETPPSYSPFCKSKTDTFMYHDKYLPASA